MRQAPQDMLRLAERLATAAAEVTRLQSGRIAASRKPDDTVVTTVDHAIQQRIVDAIRGEFPDHGIIAEESAALDEPLPDAAKARFVWVIDPLDGTRNFAAGLPCFATAIAVLDRGEPIVGVIYEHNLGLLYSASTGEGAECDGRPIRATADAEYHDHLVGIPSSKDDFAVGVLRAWAPKKGVIFRSLGSASVHLALVASGSMSAALGIQAKIWDVAAGAVLVREAGGRITAPDGRDLTPFDLTADPNHNIPFLAGSAKAHPYFLDTVRGISGRD